MKEFVYLVTGATGQFGRIAVEQMAARGMRVIAGARNPGKAADLAASGIEVRLCDYDQPETVLRALEGVDRLLLISGSEVGKRIPQHGAVIDAARAQSVGLVAYTSILHGAASPLLLAAEHTATEDMLTQSGLPHLLLRNAWYSENFQMGLPAAIEHGAIFTAAGEGRFSSATRQELAEGAMTALTGAEPGASRTYELAGSTSFSMPELAAAVSARLGREVACVNMEEAAYAAMLKDVGVPAAFAEVLAQSEAMAQVGAHFDNSRTLERLIGRTPLSMPELVENWFAPA